MHSNTWLNKPSQFTINTETDYDFFQDNKNVSQNEEIIPIKTDFIETQSPFTEKTFMPEPLTTQLSPNYYFCCIVKATKPYFMYSVSLSLIHSCHLMCYAMPLFISFNLVNIYCFSNHILPNGHSTEFPLYLANT